MPTTKYKTITTGEYPKWISKLPVSKKNTAEDYLNSFAKFCIKELAKKNIGDSGALGKSGIKIHIGDTRGRSNKDTLQVLGRCYYKGASANSETRKVEISRELEETIQVLMVTAHEVTHAVLSEDVGHTGDFCDGVYSVFKQGGIPTATTVSAEFIEVISPWLKKAGLYPYTAYIHRGKKQSTRQIKCACLDTECVGTSKQALKKGHGTIFYMSSATILLAYEAGKDLSCPICFGDAGIETEIVSGSYQ